MKCFISTRYQYEIAETKYEWISPNKIIDKLLAYLFQYQTKLIAQKMQNSPSDMFTMLKLRFPHININNINPQQSFSQNLQNIIAQIGMPQHYETSHEISQMKEAVDSQQLKIQKNLINSDDHALGQITNRTKQKKIKHEKYQIIEGIEEVESEWNYHGGSHMGEIMGDNMSEIWQFDSNKHRDWFNH